MNISELDKNLKVETTIDEPDIIWLDAKELPFSLHGISYDNALGRYTRMPDSIASTVSQGVHDLNYCTAGGRVRFRTNSTFIGIRAVMDNQPKFSHMPLTGQSGFDLYRKADTYYGYSEKYSYYHTFVPPSDMTQGYSSPFTADGTDTEYVINFPLYDNVKELYIALKKDASLSAPEAYANQKPVVFYGSSITQGGCASRPGNCYQAILSHRLNMDYINLGFSGSGKAEDEMVNYLASLDMSVFVCDYDHNAPDPEHLMRTHLPLYRAVRKAHPELPIIIMTAPEIALHPDFFLKRREVIRNTYNIAVNEGDKNVYFIDGEEFYAGDCWDICTVDGCHPNDLGFYHMAARIEKVLKNLI